MNACDQCSRRKLACSKGTPKCQRCTDDMRTCTYSVHRSAGRPKKTSKHTFTRITSPEVDYNSVFGTLDMGLEPVTPITEAPQSSVNSMSHESDERQFLELDLTTITQDMAASTYHDFLHHNNEEPGSLKSRTLDWTSDSLFTSLDRRNSFSDCICIHSLLNALQSITPIANSNDATQIFGGETMGMIRSSFSACEQLVQCPHIHPSACIMLLLALVQCIDDILYRMTVVFREEYKTALETLNGAESEDVLNASLLRRSDLMRGIMVLAAAMTMDQTEYGVKKDSLRPLGTFLEYISKIRGNFEARILELF